MVKTFECLTKSLRPYSMLVFLNQRWKLRTCGWTMQNGTRNGLMRKRRRQFQAAQTWTIHVAADRAQAIVDVALGAGANVLKPWTGLSLTLKPFKPKPALPP